MIRKPTLLRCRSMNCGRSTRRFRNSLRRKCLLRRRCLSAGLIVCTLPRPILKAHRPYPPVVPKFANPDEPSQVWSGRGKQPQWVTEKLASGLALEDLSIGRGSSVAMPEEHDS